MPRSVTLSNESIYGLLRNPKVLRAFPHMEKLHRKFRRQTRGCRCGGRIGRIKDGIINDVKLSLAGWPAADKAKLKAIIHADEVRLFVGGKVRKF